MSIHVKGINNLKINIPDSQWVFIIGENGSGKTSLLQAIAYSLKRNLPANVFLEEKCDIVNIKNTEVVTYGISRLVQFTKLINADEIFHPLYSIFKLDGKILNTTAELINLCKFNRNWYTEIKHALINIIPNLHYIDIIDRQKEIYLELSINYISTFDKEENNNLIDFNVEDDTLIEKIRFEHISADYRAVIGMIVDIMVRFYYNNPTLKNTNDIKGTVIIDNFELHLSSIWQHALPGALSKIFPNIQFIVSTYSPIPLLGAPLSNKIIHVSRDDNNNIITQVLNIDLNVLTVNSVLSSPIFNAKYKNS